MHFFFPTASLTLSCTALNASTQPSTLTSPPPVVEVVGALAGLQVVPGVVLLAAKVYSIFTYHAKPSFPFQVFSLKFSCFLILIVFFPQLQNKLIRNISSCPFLTVFSFHKNKY